MLLIYTSQITNRVKYTFNLTFKDLIGIEFTLTDSKEEFNVFEGLKCSYHEHPISNELFFRPNGLLWSKGVKKVEVSVLDYKDYKALFPVKHFSDNPIQEPALPFDPFAAIFYMVSRYEEYLPHYKDQFKRFPAAESIALKHDFLKLPVVNLWALEVKNVLKQKFPELKFKEKKFQFTPTYDIDSAYSYLHKGFIRNIGGYVKALLGFDTKDLFQRTMVLTGFAKDPFDNYDWQNNLHSLYGLKPIYFFLVGNYGEYDKNISIQVPQIQSLMKSIADYATVGIHPSYASNSDRNILKKEINRLYNVLKRNVIHSRQHFLKLSLPDTYQNLIDAGITDDYTMGYASEIGFRAGIANPFYFYNLDLEVPTNLRVHPFFIMDATFQYYLQHDPQDCLEIVKPIIDVVRKVNGHLITLWHNNSLGDDDSIDWRDLYEAIIKHIMT